jgi:hypothetical protein
MTKEAKILSAMRASPDPKVRAAAEKVAAVKGWTAEEMRLVLLEMLGRAS